MDQCSPGAGREQETRQFIDVTIAIVTQVAAMFVGSQKTLAFGMPLMRVSTI
jgi:hypothetical protein